MTDTIESLRAERDAWKAELIAVIARAERHNREGSKSFFERGAISMSVHVEDAIRALPTKREEEYELVCVNGHDCCWAGPFDNCPYCE